MPITPFSSEIWPGMCNETLLGYCFGGSSPLTLNRSSVVTFTNINFEALGGASYSDSGSGSEEFGPFRILGCCGQCPPSNVSAIEFGTPFFGYNINTRRNPSTGVCEWQGCIGVDTSDLIGASPLAGSGWSSPDTICSSWNSDFNSIPSGASISSTYSYYGPYTDTLSWTLAVDVTVSFS